MPGPDRAPGLGHNGGPPLEEDPGASLLADDPGGSLLADDPGGSWRLYCWKRAKKRAWAVPPEVALSRLARAEALGMSYKEYTLEIMERGRFL